jgi:hypothetical protein
MDFVFLIVILGACPYLAWVAMKGKPEARIGARRQLLEVGAFFGACALVAFVMTL